MITIEEPGAPEVTDLRALNPGELASTPEAAAIVVGLTRANETSGDGSEAVRVAAFNSFI